MTFEPDFYATSAQVIPVLYLAMAFESKTLWRRPDGYPWSVRGPGDPASWNGTQIVGILTIIALMAAGEIAAVALYIQNHNRLIHTLVWYGLVAGLAGVVAPVVNHQVGLLKRHVAAGGTRWILWFILVLTVYLLVQIAAFIFY